MKDLNLNIRINYLVLKNVHQCLFATPNLCITKFNMLNSAVSFFLSQHLGVIFILYRYIILKVSYYYSFQSPDYYLIWQHTWRNNETVNEKLTRRSNVFSIEFTKTSFFLTTIVEYTIPVTRLQNLISYTLFFFKRVKSPSCRHQPLYTAFNGLENNSVCFDLPLLLFQRNIRRSFLSGVSEETIIKSKRWNPNMLIYVVRK